MALESSESDWTARLSGQLLALAEVAEALTYRVLELEERLTVVPLTAVIPHRMDATAQAPPQGSRSRRRESWRPEATLEGASSGDVPPIHSAGNSSLAS